MHVCLYAPGPLKHFRCISPVAHYVCANIARTRLSGVIKRYTMIEYLLIIAFLATGWLLLKSKYLNSKKWFLLLSIVLTLGLIAYLVIDSPRPWNVKKTVLLILVVGSAVFTLVRRTFWQSQRK